MPPSRLVQYLRRQLDPLVPPNRLIFVGGNRSDFRRIGDKWLGTMIEVGGLKPTDHVLDIGCGVGRMAVALSTYLRTDGSYDGFDIVREGVEWCQRKITPRFTNFRFRFVNLQNPLYNAAAATRACDFAFPYEDGSFDFVLLASVFTHLRAEDTAHYLCEVRRVLRPGGRCLASFFLLNEETEALIAEGGARFDFKHAVGPCRTADPAAPETAIGYPEPLARRLHEEAGLLIARVLPGSWPGRPAHQVRHGQDIILAETR